MQRDVHHGLLTPPLEFGLAKATPKLPVGSQDSHLDGREADPQGLRHRSIGEAVKIGEHEGNPQRVREPIEHRGNSALRDAFHQLLLRLRQDRQRWLGRQARVLDIDEGGPLPLEVIEAMVHLDEPASNMLGTILDAVPALFAAAILLGVAYVVGRLVSGLISNLLAGSGFNNVLAKLGVGPDTTSTLPPGASPSTVVGTLILVAILLFASVEAAALLGLANLAEALYGFITLGGQVILGLVVFGIGLFLANLAATTVRANGGPQAPLLATAARVAIVVLASAMALRQTGLANEIIDLAFGILLGAIAVAVALAFGLGSRDVAGRAVERWTKKFEDQR